jgi:hypothetical protein
MAGPKCAPFSVGTPLTCIDLIKKCIKIISSKLVQAIASYSGTNIQTVRVEDKKDEMEARIVLKWRHGQDHNFQTNIQTECKTVELNHRPSLCLVNY